MDRYVETIPETGFDTSQFGEIETANAFSQFMQMKKRFWDSIGVGGSFLASPLIHNETIYVGNADKNFYALTLDGKEKWRIQVNDVIPYPAIVHHGTIYFGSFDGNIYAVTPEGRVKWKLVTQGKIMTSPVAFEQKIFTGSNDGNVYCIDAETGREEWRFHTNGPQCSPIIVDNRVLFGHEDKVFYCLSLEGRLMWKRSFPDIVNGFPPHASHGRVYVGNYDQNMYALDIATGKIIWTYKIGDVTYPAETWNGNLYFGCRENAVYCLEEETGKFKWKFKTNGNVIKITPKDGVLYFGSYDNNVYALDANTGRVKWTFKTNGFVTILTITDDSVYAGSWDCNLYCLSLEGKLVWKFRSSMGSPSQIAPPETSYMTTAQITLPTETVEKKEKYTMETLGSGPESQYVVKQTYVQQSKYTKTRKIKSMSSGWEDD